MSRARRTTGIVATLMVATALLTGAPPSVAAGAAPSVRLLAASPTVTLHRYGERGRVWLDVGIYVASVGGPFEIRVGRDDYDHPIEVIQHLSSGADRELPASVARGMVGLRRFLHVTVTNRVGRIVLDRYHAFCPSGELARVDDDGPQGPTYPPFCTGTPFTLGTVWGIDDGWAVGWSPTIRAPGVHDPAYLKGRAATSWAAPTGRPPRCPSPTRASNRTW
jgi:hypothetical protein